MHFVSPPGARIVHLVIKLNPAQQVKLGSAQGSVHFSIHLAHPDNITVKFTDGTTVVGLIPGGNEATYKHEVLILGEWSAFN